MQQTPNFISLNRASFEVSSDYGYSEVGSRAGRDDITLSADLDLTLSS